MNPTLKKLKMLLFCSLLATFGFSSCIQEGINQGEPLVIGEKLVTFSLQVPSGAKSNSYAMTENDENSVKALDILVFKTDGSYVDTRTGTLTNTNEFKVTLTIGTFDLEILANASDIINSAYPAGIPANTQKAVVFAALTKSSTQWNTTTGSPDLIPMWGKQRNIRVGDSSILSVDMLRMLAKIDVVLTHADATSVFDLKEVYLHNRNTVGRLVPDDINIGLDPDDNTKILATAPTLVAGSTPTQAASAPYLVADNISLIGEIYTFEAQKGSSTTLEQAPCLVIGGVYRDDTKPTYYRIDLIKSGTTDFLHLLRNHSYKVNISKISGRGFPTEQEAFAARSVNITANIIPWNDGQMSVVTTDGQYYLGVSKGEFTLPRTANDAAATVFIQTDYTNGWEINKIEDKDGVATWLKVDVISGLKDVKSEVKIGLDVNENSTSRVGYIYITAGRIEYRITVTQTAYADVQISIFNSLNDEIEELVFAAIDAAAPASQTFKIVWFPATKACAINTTALMGIFNYGTGDNMSTTTQTDATGAQTFTIAPAAITVLTDPFEERVSSVLVSLTKSDETTKTKNLLLRQVVKNIVVPSTMKVALDGGTKSFAIKANVGWTLTHVASNDAGKDFITSYGITSSAGSVSGDTYSFGVKSVLAADLMTYINSSVTLTLVNSEFGITKPVVITPNTCNPAEGVAGSIIVGSNTYKTHLYGTKCWMVENSKEGTASATTYPGYSIGERGYYYVWTETAGACPSGWSLPSKADFADVIAAVSGANLNQPAGKWWAGSAAVSAFAGRYAIGSKIWDYWGIVVNWWTTTAGGAVSGSTNGMNDSVQGTGYRISVRCVKQ